MFTCLFGNYESLPNQPIARETSVPFICFTDDPNLTSETWEVVYHPPILHLDPVRSQRIVKIDPPDLVREFEHSLYIDHHYTLLKDPNDFLKDFFPKSGITLFSHEFRDTVIDEFMAVIDKNLDDHLRVYEQYHHYMRTFPETLLERPFHTAILLRQNMHPEVQKLQKVWSTHISRYSRRDQLSLNIALKSVDIDPIIFELDLYRSEYSSYNFGRKPNRNSGIRNPKEAIMPELISEYLKSKLYDPAWIKKNEKRVPEIKKNAEVSMHVKIKMFLLKFKFFQSIRYILLQYFPRIAEALKEK